MLTASDPMKMAHDLGAVPRSTLIISTSASIAKFQIWLPGAVILKVYFMPRCISGSA